MTPGRPRRSPGWYQDPDDPTRVRHWNGRGWTGRRRPRPTWHVLPNDLEPDPGWVSPGGISARALQELLGEGATTDPAGYDRSEDFVDRRLGSEAPPIEDRHGIEEPYGGDPRSGPLHAERPARDWGGRAERSGHSHAGSRPQRGPGAAFGLEARWAPRPGGASWGSGGGGALSYGATAAAAGAPAGRWTRSRVPLIVVVGLTIFSVLALLVNLGSGARERFSAVSVDRSYLSQANTACLTALGGRRSGSGSVMTAGPKLPAASASRSAPSASRSAAPRSSAGPRSAAPRSSAAATPSAPSAAQLTVLAHLSSHLGAIAATPAARPQVQAWLGEWDRYVAAERDLPKAEAAHDDTAASRDQDSARVAAASADLFAADNGLPACTIGSTSGGGYESVP